MSPKKRGRPLLTEREALRSPVCVRFPLPIHDQLLQIARRSDLTLADFVRDCVFSELRKRKIAIPPVS